MLIEVAKWRKHTRSFEASHCKSPVAAVPFFVRMPQSQDEPEGP